MNQELQQHKKSDTVKWILTLIAFILIGILLVGIICGWFDRKENPPADEPSVSDEGNVGATGNGLIISSEESATQMRLAVSPLAATVSNGAEALTGESYTLTATIEPNNASNQSVDWSAAWKNASSSWANGKTVTDYVTVTPLSSGSLTATVTCLEAFGEQVIITVTTKDGTDLSAQCTCDYIKRVTKTQLKVPKSSMSDDVGFDTATSSGPYYVKLYPNISATGAGKMTTTPEYGIGTIEEELTTTVSYALSSNYYSVLASKGYTISSSEYAVVDNATSFQNNTQGCQTLFGKNFFSQVSYANAVIGSLGLAGNCMIFTVTTTGAHSSCTNTYAAYVNTTAMAVKATSVSLGEGNLQF